jgi:hypothetical protein
METKSYPGGHPGFSARPLVAVDGPEMPGIAAKQMKAVGHSVLVARSGAATLALLRASPAGAR